eukprot:m.122988 g.122988  ORF g.122988 m.122988 type:complete len:443 (-) comp16239_c1_seq1:1187-2515(-)
MLDRLQQRRAFKVGAVGAGKVVLAVLQLATLRRDETILVHEIEVLQSLLTAQALALHRIQEDVAHAEARRARADTHDTRLRERPLCSARCGEEAGECHGAGALDVVVEAAEDVLVALEQHLCIGRLEVLKLDDGVREALADGNDNLVHNLDVLGACDARVTQAHVVLVLQQLLVVGANVNEGRHAATRVNAASRDVEADLADRNGHALHAEIAQAENARAVCDDDDVDLGPRPVPDKGMHVAEVAGGKVHAARAAEEHVGVDACIADRRRVDDGRHLGNLVCDEAVEEGLVAILQGDHEEVLGHHVLVHAAGNVALVCAASSVEVVVGALGLLLEGEATGRDEAAQAQTILLALREAGALVEDGVVDDLSAKGGRRQRGGLRLLDALVQVCVQAGQDQRRVAVAALAQQRCGRGAEPAPAQQPEARPSPQRQHRVGGCVGGL